jgi:hypothetical protein
MMRRGDERAKRIALLLGVLVAAVIVGGGLATVTASGATTNVAGTWNLTYTSPPCVQGCSETDTLTETSPGLYTWTNNLGWYTTDVPISGSSATIWVCGNGGTYSQADEGACPTASGHWIYSEAFNLNPAPGDPTTVTGTNTNYSSDGSVVDGVGGPFTGTGSVAVTQDYTVSGTLTDKVCGSTGCTYPPNRGTTVLITGTDDNGNSVSETDESDTDGSWSVTVPAGSYTAGPTTQDGSTFGPAGFSPATQSVAVSTQDVTGVDFVAPSYEISGVLTNNNCGCSKVPTPEPEPDVTVDVTSDDGGGVTTSATSDSDDDANWSVEVPDGGYTVTPDDSTYSWDPTSQSVTVDGANNTNIDFDTCGKADVTSNLLGGELIAGAAAAAAAPDTKHCAFVSVKCTSPRFPSPSDCFVTVEAVKTSDGPPEGSVAVPATGSISFGAAGDDAGNCGQLTPLPSGARSYCKFYILSAPGSHHLSVLYSPLSKDWNYSEGGTSFAVAAPLATSTKQDLRNWLTTDSAMQYDIGTVLLDLGTGGGGATVLYQTQTAAKVVALETAGKTTASLALKARAAAAVEVTLATAAVGGVQKYGLSPIETALAGFFKDPPDMKYRVVAKPHPSLAIPKRYRRVFDRRNTDGIYRAAGELRALATAESTAVNRAMTAGKKGATKWRNLQVTAAIKYLRQMSADTRAMIADQIRLARAVARTPVGRSPLRFKSQKLTQEFGSLTLAQLVDNPTEIARLRHLASLYLTASKDPAHLAFPKLPALFP